MKNWIISIALVAVFLGFILNLNAEDKKMSGDIYQFSAKTIDGKIQSLADYKGKLVLVVNVASKCGFTPQYKGLEEIYKKYSSKGFVVLGFPNHQ